MNDPTAAQMKANEKAVKKAFDKTPAGKLAKSKSETKKAKDDLKVSEESNRKLHAIVAKSEESAGKQDANSGRIRTALSTINTLYKINKGETCSTEWIEAIKSDLEFEPAALQLQAH